MEGSFEMIRVANPFVGMFIHTKRVGQLMLLCVSIALCSGTVAVSYTHLDVYKRQVQ